MSAHLREQWRKAAGRTQTFIVGWSDDKDTLMSGQVTTGYSKVVVEAEDGEDARLLAEQIVAATGKEPTSVTYLE